MSWISVPIVSPGYSYRSAIMGSTRIARRAGTYPAKAVTANNTTVAAASIKGSLGLKPNSRLDQARTHESQRNAHHKTNRYQRNNFLGDRCECLVAKPPCSPPEVPFKSAAHDSRGHFPS